ncbi:hypothetical protein TUM17576_41810 [Enterobacter hormaechei]|nr:ClpX C4-type zinc finger protein [Enterobacter hormaechei]GJL37361.1 hypothetical protein TUM17576_41810 [Enterobacter hormaechei]
MGVYIGFEKIQPYKHEPDPKTVCNFCKQITADDKLITGPDVNICIECVELCNEIITERRSEFRKKNIEEMVLILCHAEEQLNVKSAYALAGSIFDAGYHKEVK